MSQRRTRDRRALLGALGLLAAPSAAEAQPAGRVYRVGILHVTPDPARKEAFRSGLSALGYIEGQPVAILDRLAEGNAHRLSELAAELVRLKVDVIVTGGASATRAAKQATSTISIVMSADDNPVEGGFVVSLGRPGGSINPTVPFHGRMLRQTSTSHPFAHAPRRMTSVSDRRRSSGDHRGGASHSMSRSWQTIDHHENARTGPSASGSRWPLARGLHGRRDRPSGSRGTAPPAKFVVVNLVAEHDVEADEELAGERHSGLGARCPAW